MTLEPTDGNSLPSAPSIPSTSSGAPEPTGSPQSVSLPSESGSGAPLSPAPAAPTEASEAAAAQAGLSQAQYDTLPKAWRKEMEAEWKSTSPNIRKYVHEREQQVLQGLSKYSKGHEQWSRLVQPFQPLLEQHPDVSPFDLMSGLANNHYILTQGTKEQKTALGQAILQHYGLTELLQPQAPGQTAPQTPFSREQMAALQQLLGPVVQQTKAISQERQQAATVQAQSEVDAFFSDPKNEFASDVEQDMLQILQQGKATTLAEAYELAVFKNPEVKAKHIAALMRKQGLQPAGNSLNVKSTNSPASPPAPATMDETMAQVLKKHYG